MSVLPVFRIACRIAPFLAIATLSSFCALAAAENLSPEQEAALRGIARGETIVWPGLSPEQVSAIEAKAEVYFERYQRRHIPHGLNVDLVWADRDRSALEQYTGLGDSAEWTGHYLAALAFRHHVEPTPSTYDAIMDTLDTFDLLTLVSGRDGYIARYAGPADDPYYARYYRNYYRRARIHRLFLGREKKAYRGEAPYDDLVWLGDSSRDVYDGIHFGLAALWVFVDDAEVRARVKTIVERVGRRLQRDCFLILDGKGNFSIQSLRSSPAWPLLMISVCPDDFSAARVKYRLCSSLYRFWGRLWGPGIRPEHERKYYPNNLNMIRLFTLCMLEECPRRKAAYQDILRNAYRDEISTHLNAFFAAIYLLCTGDDDPQAIATVQGALLDFPQDKWDRHVDLRGEVEMLDADYARYSLLPSERPPRDFLWQRPAALAHGGSDAPREYPGIDMFLPYWMARVANVFPDEGL